MLSPSIPHNAPFHLYVVKQQNKLKHIDFIQSHDHMPS